LFIITHSTDLGHYHWEGKWIALSLYRIVKGLLKEAKEIFLTGITEILT
jgi:hypothetical protein